MVELPGDLNERREMHFTGNAYGWTVEQAPEPADVAYTWTAYFGSHRQSGRADHEADARRAARTWLNAARTLYMDGYETGRNGVRLNAEMVERAYGAMKATYLPEASIHRSVSEQAAMRERLRDVLEAVLGERRDA